ncbi:MAG: response regulator [Acidobacteria bacterium]|nr:response regulator [Acidobacteriota bacterium]
MAARILVVDDNPTNLSLMEYLLRRFGYDVASATDGEKGVARAQRDTPDLILMDLQMPTLDGYEACARIKETVALRSVPVVAVTALAMVGDREKILSRGFDGYISKPIAPETFVSLVETFLAPRLRVEAPSVPEPTPGPVTTTPTGSTILVVDNAPANLALVASTLRPLGHQVIAAHSASEALALARARRPDLILSDVHMPTVNGYDFIRLVKAETGLRAIPFVFISSTVWGDKEREVGLALGADAFILRPIEPGAFIAQIEAYLSTSKQP